MTSWRDSTSVPHANAALWEKINAEVDAYEDDDGAVFHVLQPGTFDTSKPLIVLVHPGDACESDHPSEALQTRAWGYQMKMGAELLEERFEGCDVIVLHRFSSRFAFENGYEVDQDYLRALAKFHQDPKTCVLFGDDLEEASQWIIDQAKTTDRPCVFFSGAWSNKDNGCVTFVGKAIQAAGANIEVSAFSPANPGTMANAWRGKLPRKTPTP